MDVDAEPCEPGDAIGEVELPIDLELLLLLGGEDAIEERARVVGHDLLDVGKRGEIAVDPHGRRGAGDEVEIGGLDIDSAPEQVVDGGERSVHGHLAYRQGHPAP